MSVEFLFSGLGTLSFLCGALVDGNKSFMAIWGVMTVANLVLAFR